MTAASVAATGKSNSRTERTGPKATSKFRLISIIAKQAKELWRNKVAVELAVRAGVSDRTAENYLAGDRSINGNALARLLQSDAGPIFLKAIIDDLPPSKRDRWDREFERAAARAEWRQRQAALEQTGWNQG